VPNKLSVQNDALLNTANNKVTAADANTDNLEYDVSSAGYDRYLPILLERYPWNFATATEALEQREEDDNPGTDPDNSFAYDYPDDALHIEALYQGGVAIDYEIIDRTIISRFDNSSTPIIVKFVRVPDADAIGHLFWETQRTLVEAACLRGINEDFSEAERREQKAWQMLSPAAQSRNAQETPRRIPRRSRMLERRKGLR
jgi:hypothetical protein